MPDHDNVVLIDDNLWGELIELTDGEAALCFQCGVCTASCPWGAVRQKPLTVRTLIRQAQLGLRGENGDLWLCTTCAQCEVLCPRGVDITCVMRALRTIAWQRRETQEGYLHYYGPYSGTIIHGNSRHHSGLPGHLIYRFQLSILNYTRSCCTSVALLLTTSVPRRLQSL